MIFWISILVAFIAGLILGAWLSHQSTKMDRDDYERQRFTYLQEDQEVDDD